MTEQRRRKNDCEHRRSSENGLRKYVPPIEWKTTVGGAVNFIFIVLGVAGAALIYLLEGRDFMRDTRRELALQRVTNSDAVNVQRELAGALVDLRLVLTRMDQKDADYARRLDVLEGRRAP